MNTVYYIVREAYLDGKENRISYGIAACDGDTTTVLTSVHDCCVDYDAISAFAAYCNQSRLNPDDLEETVFQMLLGTAV